MVGPRNLFPFELDTVRSFFFKEEKGFNHAEHFYSTVKLYLGCYISPDMSLLVEPRSLFSLSCP